MSTEDISKGARVAAQIIMGEKEYIQTEYGVKTTVGLARLIDDKTACKDADGPKVSDAKRTAGPYEIAGPSGNMGEAFVIETSDGEKTIGWIANTWDEENKHEVTTEEDKANAVFIVRACNNHDALLEALRDVLTYYGADRPNVPNGLDEMLTVVETAIADATK